MRASPVDVVMRASPMDEETCRQMARMALVAVDLTAAAADDPAALQRLETLADLHHPVAGSAAAPAGPFPPRQSATARTAAALRRLAPEIDNLWLPALAGYLGLALTGRAPPDAPDATRAAAGLRALAGINGGPERPAARLALAAASGHIRRLADRSHEVIATALAGPDAPDVAALSQEILRLEAARFVAESVGDARLAGEFAHASRRIARIALNRAAATIDAFLAERDMMRLFDNAVVLARVDDIITIALRVLDGAATGEEEATAFVEPADQAALSGFIAAIGRLAEVLTGILRRAAGPDPKSAVFSRGLLQQIACIARFCAYLEHDRRPAALDAVADQLRQRLDSLHLPGGAARALSDH